MQSARSVAASAKETAANMTASAKSGMDKTKAVVQEKVEKISAHDPAQKYMATHKKEERIQQAEHNKQEALDHSAAARHLAAGEGNQNISIAGARGPGAVASGQGNAGGFTTPDYLTGKDIPGTEPKIPQNTNVEYPNTGTGNLAHNLNAGSNVGTGLNPGLDRSNVDAVYPADLGTGVQGNPNHNQAQYADGGAPIPGFGTGGLIETRKGSVSAASSNTGKHRERRRQRNQGKIRAGSPDEEKALVDHMKGMSLTTGAKRELKSLLLSLVMLGKEDIANRLQRIGENFQITQQAAVKLAENAMSSDVIDEQEHSLDNYIQKVKQDLQPHSDEFSWQIKVLISP